MSKDKTQKDCQLDFINACLAFIEKIDEIDNATPWSEDPPSWWLEMEKIRKFITDKISPKEA